jgi:hypothetical protein
MDNANQQQPRLTLDVVDPIDSIPLPSVSTLIQTSPSKKNVMLSKLTPIDTPLINLDASHLQPRIRSKSPILPPLATSPDVENSKSKKKKHKRSKSSSAYIEFHRANSSGELLGTETLQL